MTLIRKYEDDGRPGWTPEPQAPLIQPPVSEQMREQEQQQDDGGELLPNLTTPITQAEEVAAGLPAAPQFSSETPENLGVVVPSVQQSTESGLPEAPMPQLDRSIRVPFEQIDFEVNDDIFPGTSIPAPTLPSNNNTEAFLDAFRTGRQASQLLQPFNAPQPGVYDRNPFLEFIAGAADWVTGGISSVTGIQFERMTDVYNEYYRKGVGQMGGVSGILYGLGLPLNVIQGAANDIGRINSGIIAGIDFARQNFDRELRMSNSVLDFGRRLLGKYAEGYGQQIDLTAGNGPGTATQQALFGRQFSFSDEKINERGDFNALGLNPEYGSYTRAPQLPETPTSKTVRDSAILNSITSVIGTPVQGILSPLTGNTIKIPRFSDWLADRVKQAEQDPNNYFRSLAGFGLDAITESLAEGLPGYITKKAAKNALKSAPQVSTLAPTVQLPFSWNPSGVNERVYPRQRRLPPEDTSPITIEAEIIRSQPVVPPERRLPGGRDRRLPGSPSRPALPPSPTPIRLPSSVEPLIPPAPPRVLITDAPTVRVDAGPQLTGEALREAIADPAGRRVTSWTMTQFDSDVLEYRIQQIVYENPEFNAALLDDSTNLRSIYDRLFREEYNRIISNPDELNRIVNDQNLRQIITERYSTEATAEIDNFLDEGDLSLTNLDNIFEPTPTPTNTGALGRAFDEFLDGTDDSDIPLQSIELGNLDDPELDAFVNDAFERYDGPQLDQYIQRRSDITNAHSEIRQRIGSPAVNLTSDSYYGPLAFQVQPIDKPSKIVQWFKQFIADPRADGVSLIMGTDSFPYGSNARVGRVLERYGWDVSYQFGYARFDNINVRGIQETASEILNPRLRADRTRWRQNYYTRRLAEALDRPIERYSQLRLNQIYDIIEKADSRRLFDSTLNEMPETFARRRAEVEKFALIRATIEDVLNTNFSDLPVNIRTAILRDSDVLSTLSVDPYQTVSDITRTLNQSNLPTVGIEALSRLYNTLRTPDVIRYNDAFDELTVSLPGNQRGSGGDQVYRYRLQEFVNASTELEQTLTDLNGLQATRLALEEPIQVSPQPTTTPVDPLNPVFYLGTRTDTPLQVGSRLAQVRQVAEDFARSTSQESEQLVGSPRIVEFRNDSLLVLPEDQSATLRQQLLDLEQALDPESFIPVRDEILSTLGQDYDITADGIVLNPDVFVAGERFDIADVTDPVALRTAEFNANPNQETGANLQAQLVDQLDEQLEQGYAALDQSISRYFDAQDALEERAETLRDAIENNPQDYPVRDTPEGYRTEVESYIENDPRLQEWLDVTPPSSTYYEVWNRYADEIFEALRNDNPDRIIDTAVNFRQAHTQMWDEAAALYENVVEVYTELMNRQGQWVPDDLFPMLEDIC